ncbi:hypothetical protein ACFW4D_22370 [Paenibacillus lactis]|uniref:hypothetical protein n=1 Tax=Paenibacillus lactis TaxID=228574 RepID=UPI001643955E
MTKSRSSQRAEVNNWPGGIFNPNWAVSDEQYHSPHDGGEDLHSVMPTAGNYA